MVSKNTNATKVAFVGCLGYSGSCSLDAYCTLIFVFSLNYIFELIDSFLLQCTLKVMTLKVTLRNQYVIAKKA
jgi:hypothetical protein